MPRLPSRRSDPTERTEGYVTRRTSPPDLPSERRKLRNVELAPAVFTPATDVASAVGAHNHTGVYSPVGHTHTSGSITDFAEAVQDAVGAMVVDSASIDHTYNDVTGQSSLAVIADSTVQKVDVRKNSAGTVFSRRRVNLIEGSNVTLTVADDAGNNEIDVTIAASLAADASGVDLIDTDTFGAVATHSMNNVFGATYDFYLVYLRLTMSAIANLTLRYRVGGVDTGVASFWTVMAVVSAAAPGLAQAGNVSSANALLHGGSGVIGLDVQSNIWITEPALVNETVANVLTTTRYSTGTFSEWGGFVWNATTAFDGFTLIPSAGTIAGTARVYGYRNTP